MDILEHPNPALKQHAVDVDPKTDASLPGLVHSMASAMYDAPGVGLAAIQVGVQKRVIVIDVDDALIALCNPRIVEMSAETEIDDEGCLSFPGVYIPIERPSRCVCEAGPEGQPRPPEGRGPLRPRPSARDRPPRRPADHRPRHPRGATRGPAPLPRGE